MKKKLTILLILFTISLFGQVSQLIKTTWGQNCLYNDFTPVITNKNACNKAYAGCYAVAWAQIFYYYKFPLKPFPITVHNIYHPSHIINFETVSYNYDLMPIKVRNNNSEVAKLIHHIGIASNTNWNNINSLTDFDAEPIIKYFKFSSKIEKINLIKISKSEQLEIIKNEINNKRPVFAKNDFHYYIIDGYNENDELHFNFGWNGHFNGFYEIDNCIIPPGNLNPTQIFINITPNYDI